jgi:uncharacterized repeat protein (TIGR03803 family)
MTELQSSELGVVSARPNTVTFATIPSFRYAYGIVLLFFVSLTIAPAQTFSSLLSLDGSDGAFPQGTLTEGAYGKFYGTTPYGGEHGFGTVFEISPKGELTTLYSFCSLQNCADGAGSYGGLVKGSNGNFYGVTSDDGAGGYGGTVFEVTPKGELTTLYSFCSQPNCTDGATPYARLVQGNNGDFYGTTNSGGAYNLGTIFEINSNGKLTTLHSFCSETNCTDGEAPLLNNLVQGKDGNLYGTTPMGGAYRSGTVLEISPKGELTTLYSFCSQANCTDGAYPYAGLVQGSNGNFYGTTLQGGVSNMGTIFEITVKHELIVLHSFDGSDGAVPYAGLMQARDGNFYGTTYGGGASGYGGTVFEMSPNGVVTTLHNFCAKSSCIDGRYPVAGLMQAATGNLYGTTFVGGLYGTSECGAYGSFGCGTLFRVAGEPAVGRR